MNYNLIIQTQKNPCQINKTKTYIIYPKPPQIPFEFTALSLPRHFRKVTTKLRNTSLTTQHRNHSPQRINPIAYLHNSFAFTRSRNNNLNSNMYKTLTKEEEINRFMTLIISGFAMSCHVISYLVDGGRG